MNKEQYHANQLLSLFKKQKIATMDELKDILGTNIRMTVFRKLKELDYLSSCTHNRKYYTLKSIASFDEYGLWFFNNICFSQYGTLISSLEVLITHSESGYYTIESDRLFGVSTRKELLKLVRSKKIVREKTGGLYLYCSVDATKWRQQIKNRRIMETEHLLGHGIKGLQVSHNELKAGIILFYSLLNEKQRRLYAGLESLKFGYGGEQKIAELLGIDVHTVAKGKKEILNNNIKAERIRMPGGGRKAIKKNPGSDC